MGFDLEPMLYFVRYNLEPNVYYDTRWFPDGLPLAFHVLHNTKNPEEMDLFLRLLMMCTKPAFLARVHCPNKQIMAACKDPGAGPVLGSRALLRQARSTNPKQYVAKMCCCLEPRHKTPIFWEGKWYSRAEDVPLVSQGRHKEVRRCLLI